ncbi:PREDICTED: thyrotroph embryonic factor isoform X2 [Papilio xuthus]|uniref:Thyrotroph embryonic factor isoform X2 n=1 Tax=Papilio xuthus TaxID=66420 RepID=A0AAJ6YZK6_PAPXU|nr:PREDICTED: thyrotroph embryonic factor isoform X2 [Papilio xuthus]
MSDRDRSSPSLTDTPLKTYIGRHDDDYPLINGNGYNYDGVMPKRRGGRSLDDFLSNGASFNKKYGKSVNAKDTLEDKKDDNELWEAQAAFLGPNLWDKTLPYDPDLKYVDLDEFLSENGMPGDGLGGGHLGGSAFGPGTGLTLGLQAPVTKRERSPSPSDCMSPDTINPPLSPADSTFSMASSGRDFDPRTRAFSDEELKPQPMIKKSRKQGGMSMWSGVLTPYRRRRQFVPDDLKDDKYWARRRKNNMAAKRSRDARRMKENQIALRAGYLEKENMGLRQEVELLKKENHILREKLSKYADV